MSLILTIGRYAKDDLIQSKARNFVILIMSWEDFPVPENKLVICW